MNKLSLLLVAFVFFSFQGNSANTLNVECQEEFPANDKQALYKAYEQTAVSLRTASSTLNEAQINFKAEAGVWSVLQCLEHIITTEKSLFSMVQEALSKEATPHLRSEIKVSDHDLVKGAKDRSSKFKAPEVLQPQGKYATFNDAFSELMRVRSDIGQLINDHSVEDMRNRVIDSPFGKVDAYQLLLSIAAHTERHIQQIEEIKASAAFPAK